MQYIYIINSTLLDYALDSANAHTHTHFCLLSASYSRTVNSNYEVSH